MDLLKLTDQQIAELKKINLKYQRLNIPLHADLRLANLDLREAIESLDQKKIDEAVKKINDLHAKMFANRIDQKIEYLKTLTEETEKDTQG
jgi:Spy/CpxP family protein refolding chaperone